MDLAREKGASSWLTSLPIEEFGFALHKGAFRDALALQYSWQPPLHQHADVGPSFLLNMLSPAQKVAFPP